MPDLKKSILLGLVSLIVIMLTGCGRTITREEFLQRYQVRSGTIIDIYNPNGSVTISGWDQDEVEIAAVKESVIGPEALEETEIFIDIADRLVIETVHPSTNYQVVVNYEIKVPVDLLVGVVECSNGTIVVESVSGNLKISTSNGNITASEINGIVTAGSSNGNIVARGVKSLGKITTSNGNIEAELHNLYGNLTIETVNGSITLALSANLEADIAANTSNGTITTGALKVDVIELEQTALKGKLNGGGHRIDLATSNGSIELVELK